MNERFESLIQIADQWNNVFAESPVTLRLRATLWSFTDVGLLIKQDYLRIYSTPINYVVKIYSVQIRQLNLFIFQLIGFFNVLYENKMNLLIFIIRY